MRFSIIYRKGNRFNITFAELVFMAFAPLALKISLTINQAEVVSKSYPDFWEDLKIIGIVGSEVH